MDKVSQKIDKWHEEKGLMNKESFKKDEEYVEMDRSPTRFSSVSSSSGHEDEQFTTPT